MLREVFLRYKIMRLNKKLKSYHNTLYCYSNKDKSSLLQ